MREEIIKMAREWEWIGGAEGWTFNSYKDLERFFHMVCASEREKHIKQTFELESERDDLLNAIYALVGSVPPYTEEGEPTIPDAVITKVNAAIDKAEDIKARRQA